MTAHKEENALTVEATLRNFKPVKPFVIRWDYPLFQIDDLLNPAELKQPQKTGGRPTQAIENAEELLELLNDRGLRYGEFQHAAEVELKVKEKTFEKYFSILKLNKRISKIGNVWMRKE